MKDNKKNVAIHPGVSIKEQLVKRNMTQKELSLRIGLSEKHISKLINGDVMLTPEVATRLEMIFDIPSSYWMNLESVFRDSLQIINREIENEEEVKILKCFPFDKMMQLGWVSKVNIDYEKIIELRKFFEVSSLTNLHDSLYPNIICQKQLGNEKIKYVLYAWAQKAKLEARNIETNDINISKIKKSVNEIKNLKLMHDNDFQNKLTNILALCGIAIVFLPQFSTDDLQGTTFLDKNKIVLGITIADEDIDRFWLSLFHEIGHIVKGHMNLELITKEEEMVADDFARDILN